MIQWMRPDLADEYSDIPPFSRLVDHTSASLARIMRLNLINGVQPCYPFYTPLMLRFAVVKVVQYRTTKNPEALLQPGLMVCIGLQRTAKRTAIWR